MKINKLELFSFRCFPNYEIDLSDRFTLLIGDNGSGKTTILDALAIFIREFLLAFSKIEASDKFEFFPINIQFIGIKMGQNIIRESASYASIIASFTFQCSPHEWPISIEANNSHAVKHSFNPNPLYLQRLQNNNLNFDLIKNHFSNKNNPSTLFPVIAYYGTGRLWQKLDDIDIKSPGSRFEGYQNCLNPATDQKRFFSWFKTQELASIQKNERRHALEAVRNAIVSIIPDAKHAYWDLDWDELFIEYNSQEKSNDLPFSMLSDGYRNLIGMVADIAYRMATLNPQLEADVIKQTEGIILIDEIDLHLHPKWQRQVVGRLLDTFPKLQFVASSHSPFIIQSLFGRDDVLLWDLEKAQPVEIDSKSIEDIAEHQQGVEIPQQSQRFLDMEKAAEEYYTILKQIPPVGEEEKTRLKQRLDELLLPYSDDPAFQAFLKMERLAIEGSKER